MILLVRVLTKFTIPPIGFQRGSDGHYESQQSDCGNSPPIFHSDCANRGLLEVGDGDVGIGHSTSCIDLGVTNMVAVMVVVVGKDGICCC